MPNQPANSANGAARTKSLLGDNPNWAPVSFYCFGLAYAVSAPVTYALTTPPVQGWLGYMSIGSTHAVSTVGFVFVAELTSRTSTYNKVRDFLQTHHKARALTKGLVLLATAASTIGGYIGVVIVGGLVTAGVAGAVKVNEVTNPVFDRLCGKGPMNGSHDELSASDSTGIAEERGHEYGGPDLAERYAASEQHHHKNAALRRNSDTELGPRQVPPESMGRSISIDI